MRGLLIAFFAAFFFTSLVCFGENHLNAQEPKPDFEFKSSYLSINKWNPAVIEELKKLDSNKQPTKVRIEETAGYDALENVATWDWVKNLTISSDTISKLDPIEKMTSLTKLELRSMDQAREKPIDLAPLSKLSNLEQLDCFATRVSNPDALASLKKLKFIKLYMASVDSIDFVSALPELEDVNLYGFKHTFEDYQPLVKLEKLKKLDVYMNKQATDEKLAALSNLKTLESIHLSNCKKFTNFDFLKNSPNMKTVNANWCEGLKDASALAGLPKLESLNLMRFPLEDVSFLSGLVNLQRLNLDEVKTTNVDMLAKLVNLKSLSLRNSKVSNIGGLKNAKNLSRLNLYGSPVDNINDLAGLPALYSLDLRETNVTDFAALESCPKLTTVNLPATATEQQVETLKKNAKNSRLRITVVKPKK